MNIKKVRKEIDKLDNQLISTLKKRFELSKKVAEYKYKNSIKIFDRVRENEIVKDRIEKFKKSGFDDRRFVKKMFRMIMKKSRKIQKQRVKDIKRKI